MILMESSNILITGVGSLGCSWAKGAWSRSDGGSDIAKFSIISRLDFSQ